jgi:hypothetical protein
VEDVGKAEIDPNGQDLKHSCGIERKYRLDPMIGRATLVPEHKCTCG